MPPSAVVIPSRNSTNMRLTGSRRKSLGQLMVQSNGQLTKPTPSTQRQTNTNSRNPRLVYNSRSGRVVFRRQGRELSSGLEDSLIGSMRISRSTATITQPLMRFPSSAMILHRMPVSKVMFLMSTIMQRPPTTPSSYPTTPLSSSPSMPLEPIWMLATPKNLALLQTIPARRPFPANTAVDLETKLALTMKTRPEILAPRLPNRLRPVSTRTIVTVTAAPPPKESTSCEAPYSRCWLLSLF